MTDAFVTPVLSVNDLIGILALPDVGKGQMTKEDRLVEKRARQRSFTTATLTKRLLMTLLDGHGLLAFASLLGPGG